MLDELEKILDTCESFEEFVSNRARIVFYFEAAKEYYRVDRFDLESFTLILNQAKGLVRDIPEIGQRLWEKRENAHRMEIESTDASSGLQIQRAPWRSYYRDWLDRLAKDALPFVSHQEVFSALSKFEEKYGPEIEKLESMSKRKRADVQGEIFRRMKDDREVHSVSSYILHHGLRSHPLTNILNNLEPDADLVLRKIHEIRESPITAVAGPLRASCAILLPIIRSMVPKPSDLRSMRQLFLPRTRTTLRGSKIEIGKGKKIKYQFIEPARALHSIFRGVIFKECVGGGLHHLNSTHPARWAVPLLKDAICLHVICKKRFQGYIALIPLEKDGKKYLNVEFQSYVLLKQITSKGKRMDLYERWLQEAKELIKGKVYGLLLSRNGHVDEAGCLSTIRNSPFFVGGVTLGKGRDFNYTDDLARTIARNSVREGFSAQYPTDEMIFDAKLSGDSDIVMLELTGKGSRFAEKID